MLGRLAAQIFQLAGSRKTGGKRNAEAARDRGDWNLAEIEYRNHLAKVSGDASAYNDFGIVLCQLLFCSRTKPG